MNTLIDFMFLLVGAVIAAGLAYHYVLLIAGRDRRASHPDAAAAPSLRFALMSPAHNEQDVIGATVSRLRQIDYPPDCFDVHVVADHCADNTAAAAAAAGAFVHIRSDEPRGRKGYAVDWLIKHLLADPRRYDAIVVFDADSRVDPAFLSAVQPLLAAGAQVVQGRHVIANPGSSRFSALADADMRLNNRIRNQAKENLGLSARLMGDAMVFRREVLEQHPWMGAQSLTEDRDYGIYLATQGVRIRYTPAAVSSGQAVVHWTEATPQRMRWYGGAFDLQRRYLHTLWTLTWRKRNWDAFDKLLELALPPFSLLAIGSAALLLIHLVLIALAVQPLSRVLWPAGLVLLAVLFPFLGLMATGAPIKAYQAMLVGPFYVLWRVWIGVWVRLRYRTLSWSRTRHVEEDRSTSK